MSNKRYRLKKGLGNILEGTKCERDGNCFVFPLWGRDKQISIREEVFYPLDDWFSEIKEPERIEVSGFGSLAGLNRPEGYRITYTFNTNAPIPEEKYPAIKACIEQLLNNPEYSAIWEDYSRKYAECDIRELRADLNSHRMIVKSQDEAVEKFIEFLKGEGIALPHRTNLYKLLDHLRTLIKVRESRYTEDDIKDAIKLAAFKDPKSYLFSECQSDYDVAEKIFNQWKSQRK